MPKSVKIRSYNSPRRAEQARQTRLRVIDAATQLFLERGYPATTLATVGAQASVAADTVLHLFGSKRGLLSAVMDTLIGGDDADVPILERAQPQAMRALTDQREQIQMFAAGMTMQLERVRPMDDILRGAATVDQGVALLRNDLQLRQRRQAMTVVAGWIGANGPFRDGRDVEQAGQEIWALTSPDLHRLLRVDLSWTTEQYRRWLADTLSRTLLADLRPGSAAPDQQWLPEAGPG